MDGMDTLSFRPANHADIPALVALVTSAYRGDVSRQGWTTEADLLDGQRIDPDVLARDIGRARSRIPGATASGPRHPPVGAAGKPGAYGLANRSGGGIYRGSAPSSSSRKRLVGRPPLKPVSEPSAPITRWQGSTIGNGLRPLAAPTARVAVGRCSCAAICA